MKTLAEKTSRPRPNDIFVRPPAVASISFMMIAFLLLGSAWAGVTALAVAAEAASTRFLDAIEDGDDVSAIAAPELIAGLPSYLATYRALGGPRISREMGAFENLGVGPYGLTVQIEIVSSYPRGTLVQTLIISGIDRTPHILRLEWRGA